MGIFIMLLILFGCFCFALSILTFIFIDTNIGAGIGWFLHWIFIKPIRWLYSRCTKQYLTTEEMQALSSRVDLKKHAKLFKRFKRGLKYKQKEGILLECINVFEYPRAHDESLYGVPLFTETRGSDIPKLREYVCNKKYHSILKVCDYLEGLGFTIIYRVNDDTVKIYIKTK